MDSLTKANQKILEDLDVALQKDREAILLELAPEIERNAESRAQGGLVSKEAALKAETEKLNEALKFHSMIIELFKGFDLIKADYKQVLSPEEIAQFDSEIKKCAEVIEQKNFVPLDAENPIFQLTFRISDFMMHCFQKVGYHLFEQKRYDEAKSVYTLLGTLNPLVADYSTSLAVICNQLNQLNEAIVYASLAVALDEENPRNHLLLSNLLLKLGKKGEAKDALANVEPLIANEKRDSANWSEFTTLKQALERG